MANDELQHYGVIGMKWGKRKASYYTDKANNQITKMDQSKTRLGKSYHNHRALSYETKANVKNSMREKGVRNTISNVYGYGQEASRGNALSNYYDRKTTYTNSRLRKTIAKSNSYNAKTMAKAASRMHKSRGIRRIVDYVDAYMNRSIKTWSGRTTTTGKNAAESILTGGILNTVKDCKYYLDTKQTK